MRYLGGKERIASWILKEVEPLAQGRTIYIEPFLGSGAVFQRLSPLFEISYASDAHKDLILMWQALVEGWEPPGWISKEDYLALRNSSPSALRGFVGYGSSFGGKWFGGYVDTVWDSYHRRMTKPYLLAAKKSVLKTAEYLKSARRIEHFDYARWKPNGRCLVYCDPPYANTTGYSANGSFSHERFWRVMGKWSDQYGATVVVSESTAPKGWEILAERTRAHMLRVGDGNRTPQDHRTETLFVRGG